MNCCKSFVLTDYCPDCGKENTTDKYIRYTLRLLKSKFENMEEFKEERDNSIMAFSKIKGMIVLNEPKSK